MKIDIASFALPAILILFVVTGAFKRINVFSAFFNGAADGMRSFVGVAPALIALVFSVKLFRSSGIIEFLSGFISPVTEKLGMPDGILPLALLKPVSGSGSTALLCDIFDTYGPDSITGLTASVLCCSSETTFYTIAVYYGSCKVSNTRHTIAAALCGDIAAVIFSVLFVNIMF